MKFIPNKLIISVLVMFFLLTVNSLVSAEPTIHAGNRSITPSTSEVLYDVRPAEPDEVLDCGYSEKTIEMKRSTSKHSTIEKEQAKELLTVLGATVEAGLGGVDLSAAVELKNLLTEVTRERTTSVLGLTATTEIVLKKRKCYNQKAFVIFDKKIDKVKVSYRNSGGFFGFFSSTPEPYDLTFQEDMNRRFLVIAEYDESCDPACQISNKGATVKGVEGDALWARIQTTREEEFIIPLYWNQKDELINPIQYLPPLTH